MAPAIFDRMCSAVIDKGLLVMAIGDAREVIEWSFQSLVPEQLGLKYWRLKLWTQSGTLFLC